MPIPEILIGKWFIIKIIVDPIDYLCLLNACLSYRFDKYIKEHKDGNTAYDVEDPKEFCRFLRDNNVNVDGSNTSSQYSQRNKQGHNPKQRSNFFQKKK